MICIQLPTGKTAWVDPGWWLSLSDDQIEAFYERNQGSDTDPLTHGLPSPEEDLPEELPQQNPRYFESSADD